VAASQHDAFPTHKYGRCNLEFRWVMGNSRTGGTGEGKRRQAERPSGPRVPVKRVSQTRKRRREQTALALALAEAMARIETKHD
jgi:hypothetical protein